MAEKAPTFPPSNRPTRRTEGVQSGGRAARVIEDVLHATAEELSRTGYLALRVEAVAERSGVNKTTIYRRWPTKSELVAATLAYVLPSPVPPDTGTLRADLLQMLDTATAFASSPLGRGLVRILHTERAEPEVERLTRALRNIHRSARIQVVERAVERGELPSGTPADVVADLVFAPVLTRVSSFGEERDEVFAASVVDIVLAGVRVRYGSPALSENAVPPSGALERSERRRIPR